MIIPESLNAGDKVAVVSLSSGSIGDEKTYIAEKNGNIYFIFESNDRIVIESSNDNIGFSIVIEGNNLNFEKTLNLVESIVINNL